MIDRLSALVIAITIIAIGAIISIIYGSNAASITIMSLAALLAACTLYSSTPSELYEPTNAVYSDHVRARKIGSIFHHPDFSNWADQEREPIIGISNNVVMIANDAAVALLGRHIMGADIRTAIRHPAAAELFRPSSTPLLAGSHAQADPVSLMDYPRTGFHWTIRIARLSGNDAIVLLNDRSSIDAADRMRSDFVANASHELRTPLAAILGYVETLQDMGDDSDPMQQRFLGIIEREAQRMQQLVLDLLSISRVEADRFRRPTTPVNLTAIVASAVHQLQDSAEPRPADIISHLPDHRLPIMGDTGQLSQLAHNIIGNAMKYGRAGTPIHVHLTQEGRRAILKVSDQGNGIPPDHLPRLTERFYRVDDARNRSIGGTGLGLAIVKHIAERHQGQLSIESVVNHGTTVSISLPLINEDVPTTPASP